MKRRRGSIGLVAWGLAVAVGLTMAPVASADECAPQLVRASVGTPIDGQSVARNARVRVGEFTGCGEALPSVRPEYRLVGPQGPLAFDRISTPHAHGELVPRQPLPVGPLTIEARDPVDEHRLGPWHALRTVQVVDRIDDRPPTLEGIAAARARVVTGTIFLSPCHAMDGPVVETTIDFTLADDGPTPHDELLYMLERRPEAAGAWEPHQLFRPTQVSPGKGRLSWEDEYDFDHRWVYRLRVVDAAGHETTGERTATVVTPSSPTGTDVVELAGEVEEPTASIETPGQPPIDTGWQWGAAFGTLLGATLAGLRAPRRSVR